MNNVKRDISPKWHCSHVHQQTERVGTKYATAGKSLNREKNLARPVGAVKVDA